MYLLPTPAEFAPADPEVCHAEMILADGLPVGLRLNGIPVPCLIGVRRDWKPGEIPRLLIEVEPTYFVEVRAGEPPAFTPFNTPPPVTAEAVS